MNEQNPANMANNNQRPHPPARREVPNDRTRVRGAAPPPGKQPAPGQKPGPQRGPRRKKMPKGKLLAGVVVRVALLNVLKALVVLVCLALMVGSIAAVQVVKYVVDTTENDDVVLDLENVPLNQTSYIMALNPNNPNAKEEGDYIEYQQLVGDEDRIWVAGHEIPDNMVNAIIATEDREFLEHHGVNFRRTIGALINEFFPFQSSSFGASTIDQQLVKNLTGDDAVESAGGDRTEGYKRKIREIFRAWSLNNRYSKEMIMEAYLNTMGLSERIAGVGAGARKYFDKEVSALTLAECATIAGITRAPTYYSPFQNPDNCLKRRDDVIQFMLDCEYITEAEAKEAWAQPLGLKKPANTMATSSTFSYLSDKVYNDVVSDLMKEYGYSRSAAVNRLYNGGYRIYMTGDLNVQEQLDSIMETGYDEGGFFMDETRFPGYEASLTVNEEVKNAAGQVIGTQNVLPQAAAIVVDYDGALIATSGGIGEKTASLSLNRSIGTVIQNEDGSYRVSGSVRQVGSTMKLIGAYALGIDTGIISYSKMVMDAPIMARDPNKRDPESGTPIKDWPTNYSNTWRQSKMPVVSAIAESTNTVAAQVGDWVGRDAMFEFLTGTLQISSLVPQDMDLGPLVLGSQTYGMSAYELAGAYTMFGGEDSYGVFNSLHSYTRVTDAKGNVILEPERTSVQAIDPQSGYVLNRMLQNVVHTGSYPGGASPTAGGMALEGEMPSAGKTGTTSDDNDRWFVGLSPYYVTAVWWGYDQEHTLYRKWSAAARTNIPANVWKAVMEPIHAELPYKEFPEAPAGVRTEQFCTDSGMLYQAGCPGSMTGYYADFATPEPCVGHGGDVVGDEPTPEG